MKIYTKRGDDGSTGLLYGGRLSKDDARVEAYGSSDEAVAALGLARATCSNDTVKAQILRIQRELFVVGAELATAPENRGKLTPGQTLVTAEMVDALEHLIDRTESEIQMPQEFIVPGQSAAGAAIDLARALVRRTERRAVALARAGELPGSEVGRYLNRLADALFVLARAEEGSFTPVKDG